jgi:hypothetical protein
MLKNKNLYAKDFAELISRNVHIKKNYTSDKKGRSAAQKSPAEAYYSSEDEMKGRSVI